MKFKNCGGGEWDVLADGASIGKITKHHSIGYWYNRAADDKLIHRDYFANLKHWIRTSVTSGDYVADRT